MITERVTVGSDGIDYDLIPADGMLTAPDDAMISRYEQAVDAVEDFTGHELEQAPDLYVLEDVDQRDNESCFLRRSWSIVIDEEYAEDDDVYVHEVTHALRAENVREDAVDELQYWTPDSVRGLFDMPTRKMAFLHQEGFSEWVTDRITEDFAGGALSSQGCFCGYGYFTAIDGLYGKDAAVREGLTAPASGDDEKVRAVVAEYGNDTLQEQINDYLG